MDTSNFTDEAKKQYASLLRAAEQSSQIEGLLSSEAWQFWEGWLQHSLDDYKERLALSTEFVENHDGYVYTLGLAMALDMQLKAITQFKNAGVTARGKLKEWEEKQHEA